jgi:hypothetical protein
MCDGLDDEDVVADVALNLDTVRGSVDVAVITGLAGGSEPGSALPHSRFLRTLVMGSSGEFGMVISGLVAILRF